MKRLIYTFFALAVLVSCGGEKEPAAEPVKLTADPAELVLDWQGETRTVTITTDKLPTINNKSDWCKTKLGELKDNKVILTVEAGKNETPATREASISIIGNKQSLVYKVSQKFEEVELSIEKTQAEFSCEGGEVLINMVCSNQPEIISTSSWVGGTATELTADKKTTIRVFAGINLGANERTAKLTVKVGPQDVTVDIKQGGLSLEVAETSPVSIEEFFNQFQMGWNLGNHFDSVKNGVSGETYWGNSKCTQETFNKVKAAGFSSVRIPITWQGHIGPGPEYLLDEAWLNRVYEAVGYAEKAGLNVIINTHHDDDPDTGWLSINKAMENAASKTQVYEEFIQVWRQIALKFRDKGDFLLMEPYNEVHDGGWGWSSNFQANPQKQYDILNSWADGFVKAVRMTGGNNATRWISCAGMCANLNFTCTGLVIPKDYTTSNRMAVAFHFYDPTEFTLENQYNEWGHTAAADKKASWGDEDNVIYNLNRAKESLQDKGYPCYLGEMGCTFRGDERAKAFHFYYMEYVLKAIHDYKMPAYVWDNGTKTAGRECHGYFDHGTGDFLMYASDLVPVMIKAMTSEDPEYTLESVYNSAPAKQ